jgi:hypothetical protein
MRKFQFALLLLFAALPAGAKTINAASCSQPDAIVYLTQGAVL